MALLTLITLIISMHIITPIALLPLIPLMPQNQTQGSMSTRMWLPRVFYASQAAFKKRENQMYASPALLEGTVQSKYAHARTHTHSYVRVRTHAYTHMYLRTLPPSRHTHTIARKIAHTCTHLYTLTRTHTDTQFTRAYRQRV